MSIITVHTSTGTVLVRTSTGEGMDPAKRVSRSGKTPTDFGAWLLAQLARREMTQSDLARAIGKQTNQISRWIYIYAQPWPDACALIASALGVDEREVLERAGHIDPPPSSLTPLQDRAIALIRLIDDPLLVVVIPMLEGLRGTSPAQQAALLQELRSAAREEEHR